MATDEGFAQKLVTWELDDMVMEATITFPNDGQEHPGIVMVAGSGPTDRDWCSPLLPGTNGSGKLLAESLAGAGYTTIRFDKRASGSHVQENMQKLIGKVSMKGHADEVEKAVQALLQHAKVKAGSLYALTNSEGAIHALNYQIRSKENRFRGFILTGVPGRTVRDVARLQVKFQLESMPDSDSLMELYENKISGFESGKPYVPDTSIPQFMDLLLRSLTSPANQPFSLELWKTDALELIGKVKEPMLLVIGKKDIQVIWDVDGAILQENLSGRSNITIEFPENANHVLKHEETPREQISAASAGLSYNAASGSLDDQTLSLILKWLREN